MRILKQNIYLDIDGVILTRGVLPAMHLNKFLSYILNNYSVFWLTSKYNGNTKQIINYLTKFLEPETIFLLAQVKPTQFDLDKTEAIDFSKNFYLLDDDLFDSEVNALKAHEALDSWIKLDLMSNPDQLLDLLKSKIRLRTI